MKDQNSEGRRGYSFIVFVTSCIFMLSQQVMIFSRENNRNIISKEILEAAYNARLSLPPYATKVETTVTSNQQDFDSEIYVHEKCWDGERMDAKITTYHMLGEKKKVDMNSRSIWTGKQYQHMQKFSEEGGGQISMSISDHLPKNKVLGLTRGGSFLWGTIFYHNIIEIIKESDSAKLHESMENIGGSKCYVIEGRTKFGHCKVWIDPSFGFNLRKAVVAQKAGDLEFGTSGKIISNNIAARKVIVDDVQIEKINGDFVPMVGTLVYTQLLKEGKPLKIDFRTKRLNIEFNPDFETMGAFVMDDVPDGTYVEHMDYPGIRYIWLGGRAIVDIDLDVLDEINGVIEKEIGRSEQDQATEAIASVKSISEENQVEKYPIMRGVQQNEPGKTILSAADGSRKRRGWWIICGAVITACIVLGFFLGCRLVAKKKTKSI